MHETYMRFRALELNLLVLQNHRPRRDHRIFYPSGLGQPHYSECERRRDTKI